MRRMMLTVSALALTLSLAAAPAPEPVAEGLPAWQGVTLKNRILGRKICPSDLRHKVTIVLEVEATDQLGAQLTQALPLVGLTQLRKDGSGGFGAREEFLPHDVILVVNCCGLKDRALVRETFFPKKGAENAADLKGFTDVDVPVYEDITFPGAPEIPSRPYVYVMGPLRSDPLYQEKFDASVVSEVQSAVRRGFGEMDPGTWQPFYGFVTKSKFHPPIAKAIERQKPLDPIAKSVLSAMVGAKEPDEQKELQRLYDALNQTCSELIHKIHLEAKQEPLVALADIARLVKYWPKAKKSVEDVTDQLKSVPGLDKLGDVYAKVSVWAAPGFEVKNAAEAKKIVAELTNLKKKIVKFKDAKNPQLAAAYQLIDSKFDELISTFQSKAENK